jgi:hypothetical protein
MSINSPERMNHFSSGGISGYVATFCAPLGLGSFVPYRAWVYVGGALIVVVVDFVARIKPHPQPHTPTTL